MQRYTYIPNIIKFFIECLYIKPYLLQNKNVCNKEVLNLRTKIFYLTTMCVEISLLKIFFTDR